jgi:toxin YhaV
LSQEPVVCNGWEIYYYLPLFGKQFNDLAIDVELLSEKVDLGTLAAKDFETHPKVKLLATLIKLTTEVIPSDPLARRFALRAELKNYSRVKNLGLSARYRLFFKVFADSNRIVIIWLGYPRKEFAKDDCYEIFSKRVASGDIPNSFDELI